MTWLELYILYRIRGNPKPIPDAGGLKPKATLSKQTNAFKRQLRGMANKIFLESEALRLFRPHKAKPGILNSVGVTGKHQGPTLSVFVNENEKEVIAKNLYMLNHSCTKKNLHEIMNGKRNIQPRIFRMRGKADWDDDLPCLCKAPLSRQMPNIITKDCRPNCVSFYTCPNCHNKESEYNANLDIRNLDNRIKCNHCNKLTPIGDWRCECSIRWYLCERHCAPHRPSVQHLPSKKHNGVRANTSEMLVPPQEFAKRHRVDQSYESTLASDVNRRARDQERKGTKRKADVPQHRGPADLS